MVTRHYTPEANERIHLIREYMDQLDAKLGVEFKNLTILISGCAFRRKDGRLEYRKFEVGGEDMKLYSPERMNYDFPLESSVQVSQGTGPLRLQFEKKLEYFLHWGQETVKEVRVSDSRIPWALEASYYYAPMQEKQTRVPVTMGLVWHGPSKVDEWLNPNENQYWTRFDPKHPYWAVHS